MPIETEHIDQQNILYQTRSEEVQEIMGRMPSWIVRYGIMLAGAILCLLLFGAYYIRFPDKASANIVITSSNPPVKIIAEKGGRINSFALKQNDSVTEGQTLLELDNMASYTDVDRLRNVLKTQFKNNTYNLTGGVNYKLGDLQTDFTQLVSSIEEWQYFVQNDNSYLGIAQLEKQIAENNKLTNQLFSNETKIRENTNIDKKIYEADSRLYNKNAITENEYLLSKKNWIDQQMNLNNNKNNIVGNTIKQSELRKNILDIKQEKQKMLAEYKRNINLKIQGLLQKIEEWERINIIKTPTTGRVNLYSIWKENQYVQPGQSIMLVVPTTEPPVAKGVMPISSSGKVKIGQKILINLSSHPQNEFGFIEGVISFISSAPLDSVYAFDVKLTNGLVTNANKTIFQQPIMYGSAEILTGDKNLLERLFEKIKR
jgi:multidrug resistance efflux pump